MSQIPEDDGNKGVIGPQGEVIGSTLVSSSVSSSSIPSSISINPSDLSSLLSTASSLVERAQWASRMGMDSFGGQRDLYTALGYKKTLTLADYRGRYERGGIAARIVEFLPKIAWAGKVAVQEVEDPAIITPFEEDVISLLSMEDLNVQKNFQSGDILCGLGYYSVILIGAPGELNTELPRLTGPDSILYLTPYSQEQAPIIKLDSNKGSRRFGLAETYRIDLGSIPEGVSSTVMLPSSSIGQVDVHWSRVIHITRNSLSNRLYGIPDLRAPWNDLDNLYKLIGGGSETAWNIMSLPTLFNIDKDVTFPTPEIMETQLKEFKESIEKLRHKLEPYAYGRGVTAEVLGNKGGLPQFSSDADAIMDQIAGATGLPKHVLMGSMIGDRSSTEDKKRIDDRKDEHIRDCAEPALRQFLNRMIQYGGVRPLSLPSNGNSKVDRVKGNGNRPTYDVIWPKEEEMTEIEKGDLLVKLTTANLNQHNAGGKRILSEEEIRDRVLGLEPLEEDEEVIDKGSETEDDPIPPPGPDLNNVDLIQ